MKKHVTLLDMKIWKIWNRAEKIEVTTSMTDLDTTQISNNPTRMPINLIHLSLREDNYEDKGYKDALANPELTYMDLNKKEIKKKTQLKLREIILEYSGKIKDVEYHITTRSDAGLVTIVEELKTHKKKLEEHLNILLITQTDVENDVPYTMGPQMSYEKGFLLGLASLSVGILKN